ncbi:TIGR00725 family protein [Methanoculleus sp. FWC-SCC1]|uniref:TIGR00725 family protein n=1 Tax=Methanoculleus frigidifontis TaxID=2584085 RepID=A0ABT8M9C6_9EURY|nr:TIGR00725 family protein [Methanoculleus sp. FWC-SCC1]MDN7024520.1 TIGR00725 family protein [Methanoculleus sp. FWC-SCC1]
MQIAVIGRGDASAEECEAAETVGYLIAGNHETVVCGGLSGVMEAACRGAKEAGGTTVGILPGTEGGNRFLDVVVRTGLGHARNVVLVQSADAVIAVGGGYGTLSEIAIALKTDIPVFGYRTWEIEGVMKCLTPEEAVLLAVRAGRLFHESRSRRESGEPL